MPIPPADIAAAQALAFVKKLEVRDSIVFITIGDIEFQVYIDTDEYPRGEPMVVAPHSDTLAPGRLVQIAEYLQRTATASATEGGDDDYTEDDRGQSEVFMRMPSEDDIGRIAMNKYLSEVLLPEAVMKREVATSEWYAIKVPFGDSIDFMTRAAWGIPEHAGYFVVELKFDTKDFSDSGKPPHIEKITVPTDDKRGGSSTTHVQFAIGQQLKNILKAAMSRWWQTGRFDPWNKRDAGATDYSSTAATIGPLSDDEQEDDGIIKQPSKLPAVQRDVYTRLIEMGYEADFALLAAQVSHTVEEATDKEEDAIRAEIEAKKKQRPPMVDADGRRLSKKERQRLKLSGAPLPKPRRSQAAAGPRGGSMLDAMADETVQAPEYPYDESRGFLLHIHDYLRFRLPMCSQFCVICDLKHMWGSMLKPCVCSRNVCAFAFQELKVGEDAAQGIATDVGVIDLLVRIFKAAALSSRAESILDPYPHVFDPDRPSRAALDPDHKDMAKVREVASHIPSVSQFLGSSTMAALRMSLERCDGLAYPLFQWVVNSNRSFMVKMQVAQLKSMKTPHQYLLVMAPPEKQKSFAEKKAKYGTKFAFHGSPLENWHAILRNGLRNLSGTKLQINGAAHGDGVYFGLNAGTSIDYCRPDVSDAGGRGPPTGAFISDSNMLCLALCEIISNSYKDHGWCWTVSDDTCIMTRFLFVYDTTSFNEARGVAPDSIASEIQAAMKAYNVS